MKNFKKLCIFLLAFSLVLPIFSNIKTKADTSFSLENMSEDEIVDLIFDSCKGIYPKEGQTTEEWATYLNKKIPFLNENKLNTFKNRRWTDSDYYDFGYNNDSLNYITAFQIRYGYYAEAMDGSYHLSDNDSYAKYIFIAFNITNYKKAVKVYDIIAKKLESYYSNTTNNKNESTNIWKVGYSIRNDWDHTYINKNYGYCDHLLYLSKQSNTYTFNLYLINANDLVSPGKLATSMLDDFDDFSYTDEDEFSFDDEIELDDPVIKSITNKKGKKLVVKYSGDDSFDNEIYKIQISTNKNFKSSKEFETKKTSATISKLKKGKTYYVRIMYTVTEDGETVSSNWSKTKSIKIKK